MRQALHIFKKDVRYLRWEIGISLLLLAMFVYTQFHRGLLLRNLNDAVMSYLLLLLWAFLSARLIQAEAIPGDRQFWITRPYEWRSLLGAKLLFMLAVIGIPLLVADAVVLGLGGFSVASYSVGLVWSLFLISAGVLMWLCAFATLTRGLTQWMLAAIGTIVMFWAIWVIADAKVGGGVEWMREYGYVAIMFVVALVVLLRQYQRRGAVVSIVVMAAGLVGSSLFVNYSRPAWALELETRFSKPKIDLSALQIGARLLPHAAQPRPLGLGNGASFPLVIPIDISGLSDGQDLISDEVEISVKNESGEIWSRRGTRADNAELLHVPGGYRLMLQANRTTFERANNHPVNLRVTLYLTMLRDGASREIHAGGPRVDVPGAGHCQQTVFWENNSWIVCESPLRTPPNILVVGWGEGRRDQFLSGTSYSPFPADADSSIIPLGRYFHSGPKGFASATLTSLEPVAHFRRDLDLSGIYLTDYLWTSQF